jgi:hypothetical protein
MTQTIAQSVNAGQYTPSDITKPDFFVHQAAEALENANRPFTNGHTFVERPPVYQKVETSRTVVEGEKVTIYNPKTGKFECVYVNGKQDTSASNPVEIKVTSTTPITVHQESYFEGQNQQKVSKVEYSEFANIQPPTNNEDYDEEYIDVEVIEPSAPIPAILPASTTTVKTSEPEDDQYEETSEIVTATGQSKLHEEFDEYEHQTPILVKEEPHLLVKPISTKPSEAQPNVMSLLPVNRVDTSPSTNNDPIVFTRDSVVPTNKPSHVMSMLPGKKQETKIDLTKLKEHVGTLMKVHGGGSSETHFMGMSSRKDDQKHVYAVSKTQGAIVVPR